MNIVLVMYYKALHVALMRLAHRFDWHYAPEVGPIYPTGEYQKWCHWCGLRYTYRKADSKYKPLVEASTTNAQERSAK